MNGSTRLFLWATKVFIAEDHTISSATPEDGYYRDTPQTRLRNLT